jgi:hypothetical protein
MYDLYARSETINKLREASQQKVFLIGSFNGYWNFGDIMQWLGAVRWHQASQPGHIICSFLDIRAISSYEDISVLASISRTEHWLVYASDEETRQQALAIGLEPVELSVSRGESILHVYGGGIFNSFYGKYMIGIIEHVLSSVPFTHYFISGQQIGEEFAECMFAHCQQFKPELIGCRDPLSVDILTDRGLKAFYSGDDAYEEFQYLRTSRVTRPEPAPESAAFGVLIRLTTDIYRTPANVADPSLAIAIVKGLNTLFQVMFERFGSDCKPVAVGSLLDTRGMINDTWAGIKRTLFTQYFPQFTGLDLVGELIHGRLPAAVSILQQCRLFFTMSYHVALLMQMLGVPTYLWTFNQYYKQKQQGLGQNYKSVEDFLKLTMAEILAGQEESLLRHQRARERWLRMLGDRLGTSEGGPSRQVTRNKAGSKSLWLHLAEHENYSDIIQISKLEKETVKLEQESKSLKQQNRALADELRRVNAEKSALEQESGSLKQQNRALADELRRVNAEKSALEQESGSLKQQNSLLIEQLQFIQQSRSWRAIRKYWRALDSPVFGKLLMPIRWIMLKVFWRKAR